MAKAGRPKNKIVTKRIQYVIPQEVLDELDKKINPNSIDEDYKDRSKLITKAIKEMLGLSPKSPKKKHFENIYDKFFQTDDPTLKNKLFKPFKLETDEEIKIVDKLINKIIGGQPIASEEIEAFNNTLRNQSFWIDDNLNVNCSSECISAFLFMLELNQKYPIANHLGLCKKCKRPFFKKKSIEKFCSRTCKIQYFYNLRDKTNDPLNYKYLTEKIKKLKRDKNKSVFLFKDYNTVEGGELLRWKKIIHDCYLSCNNNYSVFKDIISKNLIGNKEQMNRSTVLLITEITSLLLDKDVKEIEDLTVDNFVNMFVDRIFPKECSRSIKLNSINDLKKFIPINRFKVEKDFLIATKKLVITKGKNDNEFLNSINELKKYYNHQFEQDYHNILSKEDIENGKKTTLLQANLLIADRKYKNGQIDECIEICNDILKIDSSYINAHGLIIDALYAKKSWEQIIYHYNKIEKTSSNYPIFIDYDNIKCLSAMAFHKNGNSEKALEILRPENLFTSNNAKKVRGLVLLEIYEDNKDFEQAKIALSKYKEYEDNLDEIKELEQELEKLESKRK